MASNAYSRTFDSVAELITRAGGDDRTSALVLGQRAPHDGGLSWFAWEAASTAVADNAMTFAVAGQAAGRWVRQLGSGPLNIQHFGGRATASRGALDPLTEFDNLPAYTAAHAYLVAHPRKHGGLVFPLDNEGDGRGYYFSQPIEWRYEGHLSGNCAGNSTIRVPLIFNNTGGIFVFHAGHPKGGSYNPTVENFEIGCRVDKNFQEYDQSKPGIYFETRIHLRNVSCRFFKGDGVLMRANSSGLTSIDGAIVFGSNGNLWRADDLDLQLNAGCGFRVADTTEYGGPAGSGGDCNVGVGTRVNVVKNGLWGIQDSSFLGCTWINFQSSDNGLYSDSTPANTRPVYCYTGSMVRVTSGAVTYHYVAIQDSVGVAPIVNNSSPTWALLYYPTGVPQFDPAAAYSPGSSMIYEGVLYTTPYYARGYEMRPGTTFDAQGKDFWQPSTDVGKNPLFVFTDYSPTEAYTHVAYYAAAQNNVNRRPTPGATDLVWSYQGDATREGGGGYGANQAFPWTATTRFMGGGGFTATHPSNQSLFLGGYTEGGMAHNIVRYGAVNLSGFHKDSDNRGAYVLGNEGGLQVSTMHIANYLSFERGGLIETLPDHSTLQFATPLFLRAPALLMAAGSPNPSSFDFQANLYRIGTSGDNSGANLQVGGAASVKELFVQQPDGTRAPLFVPKPSQGGRPAFRTLQEQLDYILTKLPA